MWKLFVDTGGTFTDCVIIDPEGNKEYLKILSSSNLSGEISEIEGHTVKLSINWPGHLQDYSGFSLLKGSKLIGQIDSCDISHNTLTIDSTLSDLKPGDLVQLTSYEEAPVLAARLATNTQLTSTFPPLSLKLGTTKGTNALLERKGARTTLLTTKGFGDILKIGDQTRPDLFALSIIKPAQIVDDVIEIEEHVTPQGELIRTADLSERQLDQIDQSESVAICLKNSYANNVNEIQLKEHLTNKNFVSVSSELYPSINLLNRTQTAVVNAYLSPLMKSYLWNIINSLGTDSELKVMTSAGTLNHPDYFNPKDALLSGPAGGVVGAAAIAEQAGLSKCLTLDMGGTSTDVARFNPGFDFNYITEVGDARLFAKSVAIETVAAGGGSICGFNGENLTVGPESSGASPGPASYGEDGPLSLTDINLLCGRVDTSQFGIPLYSVAAEHKLNEIIEQVSSIDSNINYDALLLGYLKIANQHMANAVRKISLSRGFDTSEYALLGFGGAGGQHLCDIAEELNISTICVPQYGSLLSAVGISRAKTGRTLTRQILRLYDQVSDLKAQIESLISEAESELQVEGMENIDIENITLMLRLKGQDSCLDITWNEEENVRESFKKSYVNLYGHWVDRPIEIESIKVTVIEAAKESRSEPHVPISSISNEHESKNVLFHQGWTSTPIYDWRDQTIGSEIRGPALLSNEFTTVVVNPDWTLRVGHEHVIIKRDSIDETQNNLKEFESIQLELYTNRFRSVADQMGAILQRTALSVNIKERVDFSCALLDYNGRLVINAPHIPVHLGSLGICVRSVLKVVEINEGDVIITNHPGFGGSHLPDVTLIAPVYFNGSRIGFVANRAHHAELGGTSPGSMPANAETLIEEGIVIFPQHIIKNGVAQWSLIQELLSTGPYPSRSVNENIADLEASLASITAGQKELIKLCQKFKATEVSRFMNKLNQQSSKEVFGELKKLIPHRMMAEETLDDGSIIKVALEIRDKLIIDFTGTSPTNKNNMNATPAIVNGAIIYVLRIVSKVNVPLNEGIMDNVEIILPECFLNPMFPKDPKSCPAVVGGNTEVSQRLVDTLLKPFEVIACGQGTMNNFLFGNNDFGYYETIGGGSGASEGHDGADAVHQHMTNTRITDPEIIESRYPVRLNEFSINPSTGGEGKWRGGNGIKRVFEFQEPLTCTILSQHRIIEPYGILGGQNGSVGNQYLVRDNQKTPLSGRETFEVSAGDQVIIETPGGAGFGKK